MDAAMRLVLIFTALLPLVGGCATFTQYDQLEARLRQQEDQLARYRDQVQSLTKERDALQRKSEEAITLASATSSRSSAGEPASIAFVPLVTGGRDEDDVPGHEVVHAIVQTLDADADVMKTAGTLELEMLDVAARESDRVVGRWRFAPSQAASLWQNGLLGTGYRVRLSPQGRPFPADAVLIAHFETPSGRQLDATRTIRLETVPRDLADLQVAAEADTRGSAEPMESAPQPFAATSAKSMEAINPVAVAADEWWGEQSPSRPQSADELEQAVAPQPRPAAASPMQALSIAEEAFGFDPVVDQTPETLPKREVLSPATESRAIESPRVDEPNPFAEFLDEFADEAEPLRTSDRFTERDQPLFR